ncbi:MAG: glycosyltransferase [Ignavibacteriales bacterium]|nr:glycosyltransferase [Ignavibacteriales bacterium]
MRSCSIIILNWNGKDLLAQGLPSVLAAIGFADGECEIIVADNGSEDGSVEFVRAQFPFIRVIALDKNYGFGEGYNRAIADVQSDIVVLLNNDMTVEKGFLNPLLRAFDVEDLFAVGCQIFFRDQSRRREETGKTFAYWDQGTIRFLHQEVTELDYERKYVPIIWASGGAAAFDRKKFLELGGFRSLYSPAYYEDTDLSYRAAKRGWKVSLAVESIVYHEHRASTNKRFTPAALQALIRRNQHLFLWSNISSKRMLLGHFLLLLPRLLKYGIRKNGSAEWKEFFSALPKIYRARSLNRRERTFSKLRDGDLLKNFEWKRAYLQRQRKLTILFVCPYIPCLGVHGGGNRMFYLIKGLAAEHEITVLSYVETEKEKQLARQLHKFCKNVILVVRGQSLHEPDWFHNQPHRPVKEFANPEMKRILEEEVGSGKYDLVQFEYLEMGYLARALSRRLEQNSLSVLERIEIRYEWMKMLRFETRIASLFDAVVTFTDEDAKALRDYKPRLPVHVHNLGVDVSFFSSSNSTIPEPQSLVFVGYYRHYPNEDAMKYFCKEILPLIRQKAPTVKLYIVGAEPTQFVRQLDNGTSIIVTGTVEDIRPYVAQAAVYIAPLRFGAGMRGKILEAWAMKKPVVATSVAAAGLQVYDGNNILIADTPNDFAAQVLQLLNDQQLRERLGEGGFRTVQSRYDWRLLIPQHEEIYKEMFQRSNG